MLRKVTGMNQQQIYKNTCCTRLPSTHGVKPKPLCVQSPCLRKVIYHANTISFSSYLVLLLFIDFAYIKKKGDSNLTTSINYVDVPFSSWSKLISNPKTGINRIRGALTTIASFQRWIDKLVDTYLPQGRAPHDW